MLSRLSRLSGRRAAGLTLVLAAAGSFAGVLPADAATTATTTLKPATAPNGPGGGGGDRAFCRQVTDSQTVIGKAAGDATAKLKATAAEWVKIESAAPTAIKPSVTIVRTAYQTAAKAGTNAAVTVAAVTAAGAKITTFVSSNCRAGGGGFGGGAAMTAYRDCLTKQGVTLGTPGSGSQPNASDAKLQAAMKACADKLPAGASGGFGGRGGNFEALRECLTKKGVTLPAGGLGRGPGSGGANGGGNAGGAGTQPAALDAKTQKAMQECQAAAQSASANGFSPRLQRFSNDSP